MFGWPAVVLALFALVRPRRAVIAAFITGWLFLPTAGFHLPGFTDYTKTTATSIAIMFCVALFDGNRLGAFRPKLWDLPMAVLCFSPFLTSLARGYGAYDGMSEIVYASLTWGVPYLMGRLYLTDLEAVRELAVGIFLGGLVYLPLVVYELKMSPQLHGMVYGFYPHSFAQTKRFGGWRPSVFMQHGLMCATWMCASTLVGYWLWRSRSLVRLYHMPVGWLVFAMVVISIACKSVGVAVMMLGLGGMFWGVRHYGTKWVLIAVVLSVPVYTGGRVAGLWHGHQIVDALEQVPIVGQRVDSVTMRLENNDILIQTAQQAPLLGWGYRFRAVGPAGEQKVVSDSWWTIVLGKQGLIGLAGWLAAMTAPLLVLYYRLPLRQWDTPAYGGLIAVSAGVLLFTLDSILNAMINPVFIFGLGGITALAGAMRQPVPRQVAQQAPPAHGRPTATSRPAAARPGGEPVHGTSGPS